MLIVINRCYGGFSLSDAACEMLREVYRVDPEAFRYGHEHCNRSSMALVNVVRNLGAAHASGHAADLKIVEIPDDVEWEIGDYDGIEWVAERHRKWS